MYKQLCLMVLMVISTITTAHAVDYFFEFSDGNLAYRIISKTDKTVAVEYTDGKICPIPTDTIEVPSTVTYEGETYTVTELSAFAFFQGRGSKNLKMCILPNTIKTIGHDAFWNCSQLTDVNIPESVDSIMANAFLSCRKLSEVTLPEGLQYIGSGAFQECSSITSIVIPDSVTEIGEMCFGQCSKLQSAVVGDKVIGIPPSAFRSCSALETVTIGKSVEIFGSYAFSLCSKITKLHLPASLKWINAHCMENMAALGEITVDPSSPYWKSVDGVLYSADGTVLQKFPAAKIAGDFVIPDGVVETACSAFDHVNSLTSVTFPASFRTIGETTFWLCSNVTKWDLNEGMETFCTGAFTVCKGFSEMKLPSSMRTIGHSAYHMCSMMSNLELNEGLTTIGNSVWSYCDSLRSLTLPASLDSLGVNLFSDSPNMTNLYVAKGNKKFMDIDGTVYADGGTKLWLYLPARPDSVLIVPDAVTTIGEYSVGSATNLRVVDTGANTRVIEIGAFERCSNLHSVILGEKVDSLGEGVFKYDNKITLIRVKNPVPPVFYKNTEPPALTYTKATLYVPHGCLDIYKSTFPWSKYENIVEDELSGTKEIETEDYEITIIGNEIVVNSSDTPFIEVFTMDGRVVYRGNTTRVTGLDRGLYIIRVNDTVIKAGL